MRRRELLGVLATGPLAGVAGCLGSDDVSLANFSEHDDRKVSFTGEVVQQPSEDGPLRVELRFTNEGSERKFWFEPVTLGLFHNPDDKLRSVPDTREPISLWNQDGPDIVPETPEDGCWRPQNQIVGHPSPDLKGWTLDTGDQLTERYTLLTSPDVEECLPSGAHRFETTFHVNSDHTLHFDVVAP